MPLDRRPADPEAQARQQRLAAIADELHSWVSRAEKALAHLNDLTGAQAHIETEIERLAACRRKSPPSACSFWT